VWPRGIATLEHAKSQPAVFADDALGQPNQPARHRNLRNQKLDVKNSQGNGVMIASGIDVGGGMVGGGK
jgi:hypothetical protein